MADIIDPPLELRIWRTERMLKFSTARDVKSWATAELNAWEQIESPSHARLLKILTSQKAVLANICNAANANDQPSLTQFLEHFKAGTLLSTDHRVFAVVQRMSPLDADAAMLVALTGRSDVTPQLQAMGFQSPFDIVVRLAAVSAGEFASDESVVSLG